MLIFTDFLNADVDSSWQLERFILANLIAQLHLGVTQDIRLMEWFYEANKKTDNYHAAVYYKKNNFVCISKNCVKLHMT